MRVSLQIKIQVFIVRPYLQPSQIQVYWDFMRDYES